MNKFKIGHKSVEKLSFLCFHSESQCVKHVNPKMRPFFNIEPDHLGLQAQNLNKIHGLIQRGVGGGGDRVSIIAHSLALEATYRFRKSNVCYQKNGGKLLWLLLCLCLTSHQQIRSYRDEATA